MISLFIVTFVFLLPLVCPIPFEMKDLVPETRDLVPFFCDPAPSQSEGFACNPHPPFA